MREAAEAGAYDGALWGELVELGWPGIAVAEEHGGQGLGAVELAVLLEELGYACAATPFLSTAAAAAVIQAARHRRSSARAGCPGSPAGELTAGIGAARAGRRRRRRRSRRRARSTATRRMLIESPETDPLVSIDPTRRFATRRAARASRSAAGAAERVHAAIAAEVVGVCQRALDMTLDYVKERKQFGVPVGSFQAVSHRCAEMLLHTESARSTAYYAAWAADADPVLLPEAAALAAAAAADGGREVTAGAIQVHGGIGFTWEADVHWLYKRAQLDAALLGGATRHRATLARLAAAKVRQSSRDQPH